MRLCEHPDFEQLVLRAAAHFSDRGLRPAMLEKDYFVTEVLRIVAREGSARVLFKGGTSLSKGWNLIDRFSEDIDIFLDPASFEPALGGNAINRELKRLRDAVGAHPSLTFIQHESRTVGAFGRNDYFSYVQRFGGVGEVAGRVLLEAGTASGRQPTADVELRSYLSEFLAAQQLTLGTEDEGPFPMRLLHFRRTFVEKLFAIHGKVERLKQDGTPVGAYARHYYDLFKLSAEPDVRAMLASDEYVAIKRDYDTISRASFPGGYVHPREMRFANSDALFPPPALAQALGLDYEVQCRQFCYGPYPPWADVLARFRDLRLLL